MEPPAQELTRHDPAKRRQSQRRGRERGIRIYISAAELRDAGMDPHGDPPEFRAWGRRGGSLMVRLYRD
jgi:hypothetical protein